MTQRTTQAHYHVTHRSRVGLPQPVEEPVSHTRPRIKPRAWEIGRMQSVGGKDARWASRTQEGSLIFVAYGHTCEYRRFGMRMSPIGLGRKQRCVSGWREVISRLYLACRRTRLSPMPVCGLLPHCGHVDHSTCITKDSLMGTAQCKLVVFVHLYTSLSRIAILLVTSSLSERPVRSVPDPQHYRCSLDYPVQALHLWTPNWEKQKEAQ